MPFIALDSRWRITLPKEIRDKLPFERGGAVYLEVQDGYLYVAPVDDPDMLLSSEEFLRLAMEEEDADPPENYPEFMREMAWWDKMPDDYLPVEDSCVEVGEVVDAEDVRAAAER